MHNFNFVFYVAEGRSSFAEQVCWRKESSSKWNPIDKDKRIYCTVLVFE